MPAPVPTEAATAPRGGFVNASQAPELIARQKELNRARTPGFIPAAIKKQSAESCLYIFNVGPKPQEGNGASYGRVPIQGCPEGKEHSEPFIVPGMPYEQYPMSANKLEVQFHGEETIEDPGWDWACQAMGGFTDAHGKYDGKFLHPSNSLERFGVGIARQWPPSKAEIALARKKMLTEYAKLVQQANEAHAVGKFSAISTDDHFVAARALGKTPKECRWLEFSAVSEPEEKQLCPKCRKGYEAGTVEHDCGFILDKKQYDKWAEAGLIAKK